MFKILEREQLTDNIFKMVVEAKRVAKSCLPGQFVIVRMDEEGERIPLTICDYDAEKDEMAPKFGNPEYAYTTKIKGTRLQSLAQNKCNI